MAKTKKKVTKTLKASEEFKVGKHSIGYISSDFVDEFGGIKFAKGAMPTFQKLARSMNDSEVESELKPGICELGDILAFMDNAPQKCKDGYWNLFYTPTRVVSVDWDEFYGGWSVFTWRRSDSTWRTGRRVFSPARTDHDNSMSESPLKAYTTITFTQKVPAELSQGIMQKIVDLAFENGFADGAKMEHSDIFYE